MIGRQRGATREEEIKTASVHLVDKAR